MIRFAHNGSAEVNATDSGETACQNNNERKNNVGFKVFLEVAEELRACDEADGSNEQNQTEVFDDLECLSCVADAFYGKLCIELAVEKATEYKRHDEYACVTERDTLDRDATESKTCNNDCKNRKHKECYTGDRNNTAKKFHNL